MKQIIIENAQETLGVEEYIEKRKRKKRQEIKKEQDKYPEPFSDYSSFLLLSL